MRVSLESRKAGSTRNRGRLRGWWRGRRFVAEADTCTEPDCLVRRPFRAQSVAWWSLLRRRAIFVPRDRVSLNQSMGPVT